MFAGSLLVLLLVVLLLVVLLLLYTFMVVSLACMPGWHCQRCPDTEARACSLAHQLWRALPAIMHSTLHDQTAHRQSVDVFTHMQGTLKHSSSSSSSSSSNQPTSGCALLGGQW
jgi:hypothetical protein